MKLRLQRRLQVFDDLLCHQFSASRLTRNTHAYSAGLDSDHAAARQWLSVQSKNLHDGISLNGQSKTREPDEAAVRFAAHDGQFTEVLIERYQDPAFRMRAGKNLLISRVGRPIARPSHIVSRGLKGRLDRP